MEPQVKNEINWVKDLESLGTFPNKISQTISRSLPVGDFFTTAKNEVLVVDEGKVLYIDDDHLSQAGADKARLRIKNKISQLLELK